MAVDEKTIRELTRRAIAELGPRATEVNVKRLVNDSIARLENGDNASMPKLDFPAGTVPASGTTNSNRLIITAFGKNRAGIIAEMSQVLAHHNCSIEDISQKLLQDFFTMIMIINLPSEVSLTTLKEELAGVGNRLGVRVLAQHEDIFTSMHRV